VEHTVTSDPTASMPVTGLRPTAGARSPGHLIVRNARIYAATVRGRQRRRSRSVMACSSRSATIRRRDRPGADLRSA
jgi:hypothetical protein